MDWYYVLSCMLHGSPIRIAYSHISQAAEAARELRDQGATWVHIQQHVIS